VRPEDQVDARRGPFERIRLPVAPLVHAVGPALTTGEPRMPPELQSITSMPLGLTIPDTLAEVSKCGFHTPPGRLEWQRQTTLILKGLSLA
jgi:hypothetical protein